MAEPLLFYAVAIYPHMHRVEQVLNLSLHPRLRQFVKCFMYDNRYIGLVDFIVKKIESTYSACVSGEDKAAMLSHARKFKNSTLEPRRDEDIELLFLHDIICNLPNLESITCMENRTYGMPDGVVDVKDLPDLYAELKKTTCGSHADFDLDLGHYTFPKLKQTAARILVASARAPPSKVTSFTIENGIWQSITNFEPEGKHISMLTPFIGKLHTLEISAELDDEYRREYLMHNLGSVLNLATELKHLHLDFGTVAGSPGHLTGFEDEADQPKSNLNCLLNSNISPFKPAAWPERLNSLSLGNLTCERTEYLRLLYKLKHNLKRLSLSELTIMPQKVPSADGEAKPECLVVVMHDLHQNLRLESIHLDGVFSNTKAQVWKINSYCENCRGDSSTTARRLKNYILHGGECPVEGLAIHSENDDMTEEQLNAHKHLNDDSFGMDNRYSARKKMTDAVFGGHSDIEEATHPQAELDDGEDEMGWDESSSPEQ